MIKSREEIKEFILSLECEFPVNDWQLNGFYFWPILRIRLFFHMIRQVEYQQKNGTNSAAKRNSNFLQSIIRNLKKIKGLMYLSIWFWNLPKRKYIFVSQDAHRVSYEGKRFNRFFDVLIKTYNLQNQFLYLEKMVSPRHHIIGGANLYDFDDVLYYYVKKYRKIHTKKFQFQSNSYRQFLMRLANYPETQGFVEKFSEKKLSNWYTKTVIPKIKFFEKVLHRIKPKQITILCYYSENIMLLLAAANKLNIKTVEMQHGPHSPLHLCYASWDHLPKDGYQVLPRTYWCWDQQSTDTITSWSSNNNLYKAITVGNPWVDYWTNTKGTLERQGYILYSLQPTPVSLSQLFSPAIIALIKSLGRIWYIRLHPRQLGDMPKIRQLLQDAGLIDVVNIEEATEAPLPQLLARAALHVTHYSGTAIEASQLQTKTVLLHPIGLQSFAVFVNNGRATYINPEESDFKEKFVKVLSEAEKNQLSEARYSIAKDLF